MKTFDVQTHTHDQFVNITDQVQQAVAALGITDGTITVFTPHTLCNELTTRLFFVIFRTWKTCSQFSGWAFCRSASTPG